MALWVCRKCTTKFAVGLRCCPQCTGEDVDRDEGDDMPKTTVHGGPRNVREGSDRPSPGNSSEASTPKQETSPETNEPADPKPARTTGSRSRRGRTGRSSASSTDGTNETD